MAAATRVGRTFHLLWLVADGELRGSPGGPREGNFNVSSNNQSLHVQSSQRLPFFRGMVGRRRRTCPQVTQLATGSACIQLACHTLPTSREWPRVLDGQINLSSLAGSPVQDKHVHVREPETSLYQDFTREGTLANVLHSLPSVSQHAKTRK